jgi:pyruvate/2-oxoglutarate dehydrogenase complex dihydrolipoamide acyltransferase (E2) component
MPDPVEIRVPKFPDCAEPCGACVRGQGWVVEIPVAPGDAVAAGATIIVLETNKATIEVPSPSDGRVTGVFASRNEEVKEGALLLTLEAAG